MICFRFSRCIFSLSICHQQKSQLQGFMKGHVTACEMKAPDNHKNSLVFLVVLLDECLTLLGRYELRKFTIHALSFTKRPCLSVLVPDRSHLENDSRLRDRTMGQFQIIHILCFLYIQGDNTSRVYYSVPRTVLLGSNIVHIQ